LDTTVAADILNQFDQDTVEELAQLLPRMRAFLTRNESDEESWRRLIGSEIAEQIRSTVIPVLDQLGSQQEVLTTLIREAADATPEESNPTEGEIRSYTAVVMLWVGSFVAGFILATDHSLSMMFATLVALLALWDRSFTK
jgi:hypothetical protein